MLGDATRSVTLSLGSRTPNEDRPAPASAARQAQQCRHQRVVVLLRRQRQRRRQRRQRNPGHQAEAAQAAAAGRVCLSVRRQLLCDQVRACSAGGRVTRSSNNNNNKKNKNSNKKYVRVRQINKNARDLSTLCVYVSVCVSLFACAKLCSYANVSKKTATALKQ